MSTHHFSKQSTFPVDLKSLFAWHERPGALERLNPLLCGDAYLYALSQPGD